MQPAASAIDRAESDVRSALAALVPAASEVALRYEAGLSRLVAQHRLLEHAAKPELGNAAPAAPAAPDAAPDAAPAAAPDAAPAAAAAAPAAPAAPAAAITVEDRAIILRLRDVWFRAVGVQLSRARLAAFAAYLQRLKARRTGAPPPGRAERAALVAAAASGHRPLGGIVI